MLPWHRLGAATTPEGATLRLMRRGEEFSIRLRRGAELMNSRLSGSEEALATLAVRHLANRPAPRLLIGGLGTGFTLRAAQAAVVSEAHLTVVEIVPELVEWARGPLAALFGNSLSDRRTRDPRGRCRRRDPRCGRSLRRHSTRCGQRLRRPHPARQRCALRRARPANEARSRRRDQRAWIGSARKHTRLRL